MRDDDVGIEVTDSDAPEIRTVRSSSSGPTWLGKLAGLVIIAAMVAAWFIFGG